MRKLFSRLALKAPPSWRRRAESKSDMTQDRSPLVGVADNGRVLVILDGGWAASRSSAGAWSRGIKFSADALMESFAPATAAAASDLIKDARAVLR